MAQFQAIFSGAVIGASRFVIGGMKILLITPLIAAADNETGADRMEMSLFC